MGRMTGEAQAGVLLLDDFLIGLFILLALEVIHISCPGVPG
jgi:hypothetical protein